MAYDPENSTLLVNARFHRDAFDASPASALLVRGRKIAWIGDASDAPSAERRIDLRGAVVLPGLTDAHIHVFALALARLQIDLAAFAPKSIAEVMDILKREDAGRSEGSWLQACGINEAVLTDRRLPTRAELDAEFGDRPVLMRRYCGHAAIFNSAAMHALGIDEHHPDPPSGHFERNADGTLNGVAFEQAAEEIFRAAPVPAADLLRQGICDAVEDCLRFGLTGLVEAAVGFSIGYDREAAIWDALRKDGGLPVRMGFMAQLTEAEATERHLAPVFDERWSAQTLKFFADGIVGGRTSAVSEPFCDTGGTGAFVIEPQRLIEEIGAAHRAGWRVAVHATGDLAIDAVTQAYERALAEVPADMRHRIEHCFCPPAGIFERLAAIDAMVVMQPSFLMRMGPSIEAALGPRTKSAYPGRSVLDHGVKLVLSSDAPTGLASPWLGVRAAVERRSPNGSILGQGEALDVREAIDGYVRGGAQAMRHETFRGRLEPGMAADLAAFDRDPFSAQGEQLGATRAIMTVVDGRIVHHDA